MGTLIENQIRHSLGDSNYDRVIEWLGVMKVELVAFEEPDLYNEVLRGLKDKILDETLGGDRREMWWLIRKNRVGLIDQNLSNKSEITEQESREVSARSKPFHIVKIKLTKNSFWYLGEEDQNDFYDVMSKQTSILPDRNPLSRIEKSES